jgi:hypothetical protein
MSEQLARTVEVETVHTETTQPPVENGDAADDAWLDEALAQSFPASDPLPHFHHERPTADQDGRPQDA